MQVSVQMVIDCVHDAQKKSEKLVLVVGQPGSGKSKILRSLADMRGWEYMGCDELVTEELLELVPRVRCQEAPRIMNGVLAQSITEVFLLDGMQILFMPLLKLDPLCLLRQLSRKYTIVAAWPGTYEDGKLFFEHNSGAETVKQEFPSEGVTVLQL